MQQVERNLITDLEEIFQAADWSTDGLHHLSEKQLSLSEVRVTFHDPLADDLHPRNF